MRVCFEFDRAAGEIPGARYAIEAIAPLLDARWRAAAPGTAAGAGEAPVFIGAPERAPEEAAAVVEVREWKAWDAASLAVSTRNGEQLT